MSSLLLWWFVVTCLGALALPLTFTLFKYLPDKGYAFSKIFALVIVGYITWLAGYVTPFTARTIYIAILVLGAISYLSLARTWPALKEFVATERNYIWVVEGLFLAAFLAAGAFKMRTPEIVGTEKPMDFAFLNAIGAAPQMPPQDPWLAGGSISYYYFGYFIIACVAKLAGTPYGANYNLGVALIWALTALGGFGIGMALTRRYFYAWFPAASLTVLGNLDYWHCAIQNFIYGDLHQVYYNHQPDPNISKGIAGFIAFLFNPIERRWSYFQASRIVVVPPQDKLINEFPAFSFFLSDLHPHVMGIPFVLLALALAFNLLKAPLARLEIFGRDRRWQYAQWLAVAIVFGALAFINSWDFPTILLILGLCLALQQTWAVGAWSKEWFRSLAFVGLPIVAAALLLFAPFYHKLQSQAEGIGLNSDRTDIYYLFVLFGLFLVIVLPALSARAVLAVADRTPLSTARQKAAARRAARRAECVLCGRRAQQQTAGDVCGICGGDLAPEVDAEVTPVVNETARFYLRELGAWLAIEGKSPWYGYAVAGVIIAVLIVTTLGTFNLATLLLSLLFIFLSLVSLTAKRESKEVIFATLLCIVSFALIAFCEVFYIKDVFQGGPLRRMNTVFKFHYQVWILLSVASAPLLQWLIEKRWPVWHAWKRNAWAVVACLALFGAAMYPLLASDTRAASKDAAQVTIDGTESFRRDRPADAAAIDWIRTNVRAEAGHKIPVVLEAWGGSYSDYARISARTGLPTVLGWDGHENQWRGSDAHGLIRGDASDDTLDARRRDVDAIYTTTDLAQARALLKKYGVDYVYVGDLEREKYKNNAAGLEKFAQLGRVVFSQDKSALYRIAQ